ncbi:spore germination protein [Paenibacillus sp. 1001270B_150601_E10]|uniref:spore germination protein n=1 Tax=Paenibacillus sp. 1001270B_150601_E10 TaxID=2787079 RepID=UPI00189ED8FF|nr:spore germination protein [Paenibacillus sp. 1001270B_150601_E10]
MITIGELSRTLKEPTKSHDFKSERLQHGSQELFVYYFESLCDITIIRERISGPFTRNPEGVSFISVLTAELQCDEITDLNRVVEKLLLGYLIIFYDNRVFACSAAKILTNQVREATVEATIQGAHYSLTENLQSNLNLIRFRYPTENLVTKERIVGEVSKTKLILLYDKKKVSDSLLKQINQQLDEVRADIVQSLGQLEALMTKRKYRLFPIMLNTERPDRIVFNLAQGKVVLLIQGVPFALIAPAVFYDFISAVDDQYQSYWVTRSVIVLRYVALLIMITLPALYIAIVSYNPEIFRVQLAVSIAGSRATVPYPSFVEVFIMLFIIETLIEASIRLPKYIGQTATTVGGLILGQAAQQAGLVSSIMIIVTSAVAIVNFVIPINAMGFAMRTVKYPFILFAMLFGITGIIAGLFCFIMYLASIRSYEVPYFRIFAGEKNVTGYKQRESS